MPIGTMSVHRSSLISVIGSGMEATPAVIAESLTTQAPKAPSLRAAAFVIVSSPRVRTSVSLGSPGFGTKFATSTLEPAANDAGAVEMPAQAVGDCVPLRKLRRTERAITRRP